MNSFQAKVAAWMQVCFGPVIAADKVERNHRFLEEALELVQACDCTPEEAHKLVDYVYGRAVGERSQEVGGVMVTLAALCRAQNISLHDSALTEYLRISEPEVIERIREKQKRKPAMSPLPGAYPDRLEIAGREELQEWFGLSYASFAILPRVVMEAMPQAWQTSMGRLLMEYSKAFVNEPDIDELLVTVKSGGRFVTLPNWLTNYRHPDRKAVDHAMGRSGDDK